MYIYLLGQATTDSMFSMRRPEPLTSEEELLWRSLMQLLIRIPRVTEEDFGHDSNLGTSQYLVLMHLSEASGHPLRMSDLASKAGLSPSRVTRVVDDLARAGLVVRSRSTSDGRGNLASLTAAGMTRRQSAHVPHLLRVRTRFLHGLPAADVAVAARVLSQMLDNLKESTGESGGADSIPGRT
ncbi:MAG TPA: MarR family transcriptional regulator [Acidimicrobiales bacterium]|jgi:DNA-binding MarR family transcriptional regulator|nr:MarR family transcriptional regulator [Acidimicrobiales bacterium]